MTVMSSVGAYLVVLVALVWLWHRLCDLNKRLGR
jgi:hypothetical protein